MDNQKSLIHAIDEIANLHDLGKKTSETLKEVTLRTIAIENLLIQKGIIDKKEIVQEMEKKRHP